jgi:hypothetical protein
MGADPEKLKDKRLTEKVLGARPVRRSIFLEAL